MGYTHGGEDDTDWGCVYRSVQNAQAYMHVPMWSVTELVQHTGRGWGSWSEPADFTDVFPGARTRTLLLGSSRKWLKLTRADQYEPIVTRYRFRRDAAYVVDDGVSGYAIVPHGGKLWFVDPHTATPAPVPFTDQLFRATGWMVLEIANQGN
jgi:hypothetical protein